MGFLAPWFLAGLTAVGLPIYIHLLKRHKTIPLPFSSLMFFERRTQSSVKHRRLQYLLLFALRTLFIVLLMLAFARPFIHSSSIVSAQGGRSVVLAVDSSFSMRQGDRFSRAKAEATAFVDQLHGGDRAEVLDFATQTHLLTEFTNDHGALRNAIASIEPSDGSSSYADLTRELRAIAQPLHNGIEVHLFSDMQKSSMPASFSDLQLTPNIKLIAHPVADKTIPNYTVEGVIAPRHIYDPKRVRIQATVAGLGTPAAHTVVSLLLNNKPVASKPVDIPANGRASVEFLAPDAPYGLNRGEVRIQAADAFPADDHFYFSTERADPRPALFVQDPRDTRAFLYFRTALESSNEPAFTLVSASPEQAANLTLSKYAFIVLSDPAPPTKAFESNLRDFVRGGGSVFIALGRQSTNRATVPVADLPISTEHYQTPDAGRFNSVTYLDASHPAIRRANQWEGIKFFHTVCVQPGGSRVIAKLADGTPLLTETKVGEGRVLVFASTFDNVSNDLPISPSFVPFVEQTSHYLGNIDDRPATYTAGSYLDLRSSRQQSGSVEVSGPKGERVLTLSEAAKAQGVTLANEGFYDVRRPSGTRELAAVNPDRKESNLETIPTETLQLWENTGEPASRPGGSPQPVAGSEPRTVDFWWYVMIAALFLAIAESLLGNRHLGVEKEAA
ncbi:MAG: conserved hypothetical rane protein [Bryobacterales bacterium]|nr:conserved hypothetical rane protein [Bryobacterales bacterium]